MRVQSKLEGVRSISRDTSHRSLQNNLIQAKIKFETDHFKSRILYGLQLFHDVYLILKGCLNC